MQIEKCTNCVKNYSQRTFKYAVIINMTLGITFLKHIVPWHTQTGRHIIYIHIYTRARVHGPSSVNVSAMNAGSVYITIYYFNSTAECFFFVSHFNWHYLVSRIQRARLTARRIICLFFFFATQINS